jgi:molybdopterin-guanine dinucleotide biosynthesis protein B
LGKDALDKILKKLGGRDCGDCGYETCKELAEAVLNNKESVYKCVYVDHVAITVNGEEIKIKEFVQSFIAGTIVGFATKLKDIPNNFKEIEIKIKRS